MSLFLVLAVLARIVRLDVAQKKLLLRKVLWKKTQHSKMMIRHSGSDRTSNCKTVKFDFNNIPGQIIFNKLFSKLGLHLPHLLTIQYHNKKFRQQIFFEKKKLSWHRDSNPWQFDFLHELCLPWRDLHLSDWSFSLISWTLTSREPFNGHLIHDFCHQQTDPKFVQ